MKLEFIDDISNDGKFKGVEVNQLIRLYDFDQIQAANFRIIIHKRLIEHNEQLNLIEIDFIEAINCNLTLQISETDIGIRSNDNFSFICYLTKNGYKNMMNLIEPFCKHDSDGFQWLYDIDTPIEFLFSIGGQW